MSHVEAVGRHLHFSSQSCLNLTVIFFGSPPGGTVYVPVMNLKSFGNVAAVLSLSVPSGEATQNKKIDYLKYNSCIITNCHLMAKPVYNWCKNSCHLAFFLN